MGLLGSIRSRICEPHGRGSIFFIVYKLAKTGSGNNCIVFAHSPVKSKERVRGKKINVFVDGSGKSPRTPEVAE